ncbi:NHL repeat-containing protein, partial [bacterium]|nr:NHL repeat-containing protein [bacterium]
MKKLWEVIKFVGRLFFKPRTTFKGYKIALVCLLNFILIMNLLTIIIVIFSIAIGFFISEITLPLLIVPVITILFFALTSLTPRYKRVFLTCGIALPIIFWIIIPIAFSKISEAPMNYFVSPSALAIDNNGNLYSLCIQSPNIFKFNPDGQLVSKFKVESGMQKIVVDSKGKIYVAIYKGRGAGKCVKLDTEGKTIKEFPVKLDRMCDLAVDRKGNIYILTRWGKSLWERWVRVFSVEGKFLYTITKDFYKEKAKERPKRYMPWGITFDKEENLYIANFFGQIIKFDHTGHLLKIFFEDIDPNKSPHRRLISVDVDEEGYIYTAYSRRGTAPPTTPPIIKLNPTGEKIAVFDYPLQGSNFLSEITVDREGNIYAISGYESKILKFDKNGNLLLSIAPSNFWARIYSKIAIKSSIQWG